MNRQMEVSGHVDSDRRRHNRSDCNEHDRNRVDWGDERECERNTRRLRRERSESTNYATLFDRGVVLATDIGQVTLFQFGNA